MNEIIETDRLVLRNFKLDDLNDYYEYAQEDEIGFNCGWHPFKSKDEAAKKLDIMINANYPYYAIVLKSNNKVIGNISLSNPDIRRYPNVKLEDIAKELGFALSKYYRKNGYMTEAVKGLIEYAFNTLNIPAIYSITSNQNLSSIKVQEKCKFTTIGEKIDVKWIDGTIQEMVIRKVGNKEFNNND